ncbi:Uncharacterised protein [Burkholderia pseudomallei]|uniref:hypothetical protein n=1 Tax=Burkholderia pseudomallei TaxID=28450 RepID=UPI000F048914|nr:hypothetical protein [Burkholderia pseudomallei]CAJ6880788.1 Uncharacterised protein [Burkholderia pseudomallei]VBI24585.1 Uncharacterised protein [Burkholderia pseudomallei]
MSEKREVIQQKFEQCLLDGLTGQPLVNKGSPVVDPTTGEVLMGPPDSSFLSVVRAYLKDLMDPNSKEKMPQTGKAQGMLAAFEKKLPFGARPN